jgi:hypothetical protein
MFQGLLAAPPVNLPSRQIRVPVWVESRSGEPLAVKDLQATLEGAPSRVLDVKGPGNDLMLLVVLDLVGDLFLVEPAKDAFIAEINKLPSNTYVGLLRAQDGLKVLVDPTADRAAVSTAVENLPVSGKAGLLETVETIAQIGDNILSKTAVRVAVLYVTDSDIANYREDYTNPVINSSDAHDLSRRFPEALIQEKISKLEGALAARQTPLFIAHLRYRGDRLNEAYQNGLKQIADRTGGASLVCRSSAEIPESIQHIVELISSQYSVTLAVPDRKGTNVQVQLEDGSHRTLSYRTRFSLKTRTR